MPASSNNLGIETSCSSLPSSGLGEKLFVFISNLLRRRLGRGKTKKRHDGAWKRPT